MADTPAPANQIGWIDVTAQESVRRCSQHSGLKALHRTE